jgi:hypothetical protein
MEHFQESFPVSTSRNGFSIENGRFLEMFHKDEEALFTQGIREEDITLMLDLL